MIITVADLENIIPLQQLYAWASDTGQNENDPEAIKRIETGIAFAVSIAENKYKEGGYNIENFVNDEFTKGIMCDIAIYRVAMRRNADEHRTAAYDKAMKYLEQVSKKEQMPDGKAEETSEIIVQTRPATLINRFDSMP